MPKVDPMCLSDSVSFGTEKLGQHVNGNGKTRIPIDRNRLESMPIFGRISLDKILYPILSLYTQVYKWVPATYC